VSRRHLAALVVTLAASVAAAHGAQAAGLPTIYVDYRDDCTFRVTNDAGAAVSQLPAGTYQFAISTGEPFASYNLSAFTDLTACKGAPNFRLTGPGVSYFTTLDGGDSAYALEGFVLQAGGTYTMQDDHNVAATRRTIAVTAAAPGSSSSTKTTTTSPAPKPAPVDRTLRGTLAGSVTTAGKLALTLKSRPVTTLRTGRYQLTVLDETSRTAFVLQHVGEKPVTITTKPFLGRRTIKVTLAPGRWAYYSAPGRKRYFVVTR
jgi:hypothetical protein